MAMYYNGKKVRNLYYNGKCITRLALGKEMTRLVEGDDFVRAQWLVGNGGAYINTRTPITAFSDVLEFEFIVKGTNSQGGNVEIIGTLGDDFRIICFGGNYIYLAYCNINYGGTQDYFIKNSGTILKVILSSDGTHYYRNVNGVDLQPCDVGNMVAGDYGELLIFRIRPLQGYETFYYDGKFSYVKLGTKLNLTPCRLLRPIPATLDANGIARNADECGMYNSVNGLFYGNVASSGTLTVSDN